MTVGYGGEGTENYTILSSLVEIMVVHTILSYTQI